MRAAGSLINYILTFGSLLGLPAAVAMVAIAPIEKTQGVVQKIFYLHLGVVAAMYLAILIGTIAAIHFLVTKKDRSDSLSHAAIEVAFLFATAVVITGSLWAKPVWGAWWTWDPRLTTLLFIWLLYGAYLIVRRQFADLPQAKTWCAAMAIIAFLDVPMVHFSVKLFPSVHPQVLNKGGIAAPMVTPLLSMVVVFAILSVALILVRFRLDCLEQRLDQLESMDGEIK